MAAGVRVPRRTLARIVVVAELAVLDLGECVLGYVDPARGRGRGSSATTTREQRRGPHRRREGQSGSRARRVAVDLLQPFRSVSATAEGGRVNGGPSWPVDAHGG